MTSPEIPETGITEGGTEGAFRDVLSKDHAKRGKPPVHFADMTDEERIAKATDLGLPKFRVKQLANHYYGHFDVNAAEFTDFPAAKREEAAAAFFPRLITEVTRQVADNGTTIKTLWRLFDGSLIESVLMRYPTRTTLCISSQVGCGMGCPFCATGQLGLTRNMSAGEILEQVRVAAKMMRDGEVAGGPGRLSNIVFMGMGEPMGNYRSVLSAVRQISALPPEGFGISARNITVSTVGVVSGIRKLAAEGLPVRLAVSLHAPSDELRAITVTIGPMSTPSRSIPSKVPSGRHPSRRTRPGSLRSCTPRASPPRCVTRAARTSTVPAASSPPRNADVHSQIPRVWMAARRIRFVGPPSILANES